MPVEQSLELAPHVEHLGEEALRERELVTPDAVVRLEQPRRAALAHRVETVAIRCLRDLREVRRRILDVLAAEAWRFEADSSAPDLPASPA